MQIYIIRRLWNANLTSNNFDIIKEASNRTGLVVNDCSSVKYAIKKGGKDDIYFATIIEDVIALHFAGRENIYFWIQGIVPEESFMRNHSSLKKFILSLEEKMALKYSKCCLPVSNAMIQHFETKYGLRIREKSHVFPCFNTTLCDMAFDEVNKYEHNVFIYAGGLLVWQCFEETLDLYKSIEDLQMPNTKLMIMTKDQELALKEIQKRGIKNYEIGFTTKEDLPNYLAKAKFGFVIRKDNPVNKVSTPTKISSYLSCGVIPICGETVKSMVEIAKNTPYVICWKDNDSCIPDIKLMMSKKIDKEAIKKDYQEVFNTIYSNKYHAQRIYELLCKNHLAQKEK